MIVDKTNAEHYFWGDGCDGWHFVKCDALSVIQEKIPPGKSEKRHLHQNSRQVFYILKGVAVIEVNQVLHQLTTGQSIEILPNIPHKFMNKSVEDVEFIVISTPKSHGDRIDL